MRLGVHYLVTVVTIVGTRHLKAQANLSRLFPAATPIGKKLLGVVVADVVILVPKPVLSEVLGAALCS